MIARKISSRINRMQSETLIRSLAMRRSPARGRRSLSSFSWPLYGMEVIKADQGLWSARARTTAWIYSAPSSRHVRDQRGPSGPSASNNTRTSHFRGIHGMRREFALAVPIYGYKCPGKCPPDVRFQPSSILTAGWSGGTPWPNVTTLSGSIWTCRVTTSGFVLW
jgi:hypothetical protein